MRKGEDWRTEDEDDDDFDFFLIYYFCFVMPMLVTLFSVILFG